MLSDGGTVTCSSVLTTYGEKNLIQFMQDKLDNNIVVIERLLQMVCSVIVILNESF